MTPNSFVKTLTIIHFVLVAGLVILAGIFSYDDIGTAKFSFDTTDMFLLIFPVIVISTLTMSRIMFQKMVQNAKNMEGLKKMLTQYQTASIVKFALIESPAMFGIVMYMVSKNATFIAISGVLILYLILQRPSKSKIENDLELRGEARNQFRKYDSVID
ncbi:hypothetical protein [uncultured Kordia sp.]|uniref:hypothetical protein n=1 Tax=uncultured Kordia sp. TaxID=507699 RepID=UPI00261D0CDC|nr:hypothetical protein [uncultured Kordia sp.]